MTPTMGRTLWERLTNDPRDSVTFHVFHDRYKKLVYGWALKWTGDRQLADEITVNVFTAVFRRLANPDREPPALPGGSFRPYLKAAAYRAIAKVNQTRQTAVASGLDPDQLGWAEDLGRRVAEHEQVERELPQWVKIYKEALAELRRDPQFSAGSFADFLSIYYHQLVAREAGPSGRERDRESNRSEGATGRNARRVLDRLAHAMLARAGEVPAESPDRAARRQRMLVILEAVWRDHGHLSD